jgi:nucleotide-binding universal stress UspA family protein
MKVTAVQSWWSRVVGNIQSPFAPSLSPSDGERVAEGRVRGSTAPTRSISSTPSNRTPSWVPDVALGLRYAPVESQFWADFARQSAVAPSAEASKPAPAVKPLGILVPTDFSPASLPALDCALGIARQHAARVTLLHAINLNLTPFGPAHAARLKASLCQEALAKADPILAAARKLGITAFCVLPEGRPAATVAQISGQCQPDLIILTNSPRGTLARLFGGRTVEKVVRSARCPVLVLPAA